MLSLGKWLVEYGHQLKAIFITTKLPSSESNIRGLYDMLHKSGLAYTYFKLSTNRILPIRFALRALPTTIPELVHCYRLPIDIFYVENINDPHVIKQIRSYAPKILLSFSATKRFSDELVMIPSRVALNIHYALLPGYAGLSPYYWYVHHQEPISGITMHVIVSKLDAGPIICQEQFSTTGIRSVMGLLIKQMELVSPTLCRFYRGELHEDDAVSQDLSKRSYFRHPSRMQIQEFHRKKLVFAGRQDIKRLANMAKELRDRADAVVQPHWKQLIVSSEVDPKVLKESESAQESWYIPEKKKVESGWLVYTLDFVLATLQGRVAEQHRVIRTAPWLVVGHLVRGGMAIAQAIIMLLAWVPVVSWFLETIARTFTRNAAGFFLRCCYWKAKLKHLGCDTIIDQGVEIWGPGSVSIGSHCHIDTNVRLAAGERRHGQHGFIKIGNHVHLGPGVHIAGRGRVEIHDMVGISANAHLYSATGTFERPDDPGQLISMSHMAPEDQQFVYEGKIVVEEYAFIGMMTRVMPNVRIGRAAIVHSNVQVDRDVPAFGNFGGLPRGRLIGMRRPRRKSPKFRPESDGDGQTAAEEGPLDASESAN